MSKDMIDETNEGVEELLGACMVVVVLIKKVERRIHINATIGFL